MNVDLEGNVSYADMYKDWRDAQNRPMAFPVITTQDISGPSEAKTKTIDDVKYVYYVFDATNCKGQYNSWPNGPFRNSVPNMSGWPFSGAITSLQIKEGEAARIVLPSDPDAEAFGVSGEGSKFAVVYECSAAPTETKKLTLIQTHQDWIMKAGSTTYLIGYDADSNKIQNLGKVMEIEPSFKIELKPFMGSCGEFCESGQPEDIDNLGKDPDKEAAGEYGPTDCAPFTIIEECEEDCGGGGCGGTEGTPSIIPLRWYNLPLAYAETKNGVGHQQFAETTQGSFTLPRSGEHFEAMMGVPETEKLYINGGGSEGQMDVQHEFVEVTHTFTVCWTESYTCVGHGDPKTYPHNHGTISNRELKILVCFMAGSYKV